ncbi:MAG: hypothetical protein LQ352_007255 [Teloschistes flavicans]|nr:MAG: hypothetical protein LQ352_007255 [Teloschistes flavicans]
MRRYSDLVLPRGISFFKIINFVFFSSKPRNMLVLSLWPHVLFAWLIMPCAAYVLSPDWKALSNRQDLVTVEIKHVGGDVVSFNGFEIASCGTPEKPTSQFNNMISFLYYAKPHLQAVIEDAQQGVQSQHGYAAFFKSSTNIRRVTGILQNILDANPLIVDEDRARIIKTHTPQPRFVCINADDESVANITKLCNRSLRYGIDTADPMLVFPGKERIAVCPSFFRVAHFRPPPCPTLTSDGKFERQDMTLMRTSFAYFVYTLAMMYNRDMWQAKLDYGNLSDMQDAVSLDSRQSMHNPENFGFYAGAVVHNSENARTNLGKECLELGGGLGNFSLSLLTKCFVCGD